MLIYYREYVSALRNKVPIEMFKEKRKKKIFFIFVFTWLTISVVRITGDYKLFFNIEWFKELLSGLAFAIIIFIGICISDYIGKARQNRKFAK
jgi:hypothetical protein